MGDTFRYDRDSIKPALAAKLEALTQDARFTEYDDIQLERMLSHHSVVETLAYGPETTLARWLDASILDDMGCDF